VFKNSVIDLPARCLGRVLHEQPPPLLPESKVFAPPRIL
jgi:hypothetical protein